MAWGNSEIQDGRSKMADLMTSYDVISQPITILSCWASLGLSTYTIGIILSMCLIITKTQGGFYQPPLLVWLAGGISWYIFGSMSGRRVRDELMEKIWYSKKEKTSWWSFVHVQSQLYRCITKLLTRIRAEKMLWVSRKESWDFVNEVRCFRLKLVSSESKILFSH